MSKFLKVVVNVILLCAILVAGGLLIPPFAGVTTVIVDDVDMDTNLAKGSVTYALEKDRSEFKVGSKILVNDEGDSQYVYEITAVDGEACTLEDKLSTDGGTREMTLGSTEEKVLFTVPFIGYVTMALKTTEGLIIVGLAVVFVIILFILAEIWKKDDDEDEEDEDEEDEDEAEDSDEDDGEEPELSRREQKKARKAQKKAEKAAAKKAAKEEKKARKSRPEDDDEEESPEAEVKKAAEAPERKTSKEDQKLFDETSSALAADIASMLGLEQDGAASFDQDELPEDDQWDMMKEDSEPVQNEKPGEKRIAIPIYTKEELIEKAKAAGEEPDIVEDESSGITFLDYSDIL